MWTCIEERDHSVQYGRNMRKIVFGNIFNDFQAAYSGQPIDNTDRRNLTVSTFVNLLTEHLPQPRNLS